MTPVACLAIEPAAGLHRLAVAYDDGQRLHHDRPEPPATPQHQADGRAGQQDQ